MSRLKVKHLIETKFFRRFMIFCILISLIQLAVDSPSLDPDSSLKNALIWIDVSTIAMFTIELLLKLVAYGVNLRDKKSYFRDGWNWLDLIILIFAYLCLSPIAKTLKFIQALRILRSLRLVAKNEGLKIAVRALFLAMPNIISITVIMFLFFMIFGVVSVSQYKGRMFYCDFSQVDLLETLETKWDCLNAGGLWLNRDYNWDSINNALAQLFVMSTTAGWGDMI